VILLTTVGGLMFWEAFAALLRPKPRGRSPRAVRAAMSGSMDCR
jgi:hypothetical protein